MFVFVSVFLFICLRVCLFVGVVCLFVGLIACVVVCLFDCVFVGAQWVFGVYDYVFVDVFVFCVLLMLRNRLSVSLVLI